jgi:hypothetical protein
MKPIIVLIIFCISLIGCEKKEVSAKETSSPSAIESNNIFVDDVNISLIQTGEFKPLKLLEQIERTKYNILSNYFSEKNIDYYYFTDDNKYFLSENKNIDFENGNIGYTIFHYDAFKNKYNGWRGNPTGKFSVLFNNESEIIGIYSFR